VAERKGAQGNRMLEFPWLMEELSAGFFAQVLSTSHTVNVKRLDGAWQQLSH
jgi:hypothetical protein